MVVLSGMAVALRDFKNRFMPHNELNRKSILNARLAADIVNIH